MMFYTGEYDWTICDLKYYILCVAILQFNICPTIALTHGLSSYSEMIWTQGFFHELLSGGASTKMDHTILSVERWKIVVGDKKFCVVSYVLVGGSGTQGVFSPGKCFEFFHPIGLKCEHFLKQIFGYTVLHCALIDQIWSVKYFLHGLFM
jgi:hypothetical protein